MSENELKKCKRLGCGKEYYEKANTDSKKTIIKEVQSSNAVKKTSKKQKNDYKYNHKKNYKKNYKKNKVHHNKSDEII